MMAWKRVFLISFTSVARAPYIRILANSTDFSRRQAEAGVWSIVELNIGIACANLMRLKPFLRTYLPGLVSKLGFSSGKNSKRPQEESSSRGLSTWRNGKHSHSIQPHSVDGGKSRDRDGRGGMDPGKVKGMHRDDGSTDSILRL